MKQSQVDTEGQVCTDQGEIGLIACTTTALCCVIHNTRPNLQTCTHTHTHTQLRGKHSSYADLTIAWMLCFQSCFLISIMEDSRFWLKCRALVTHVANMNGVLGSCLWPGPASNIVTIWRTNQHIVEDDCPWVHLPLLPPPSWRADGLYAIK